MKKPFDFVLTINFGTKKLFTRKIAKLTRNNNVEIEVLQYLYVLKCSEVCIYMFDKCREEKSGSRRTQETTRK